MKCQLCGAELYVGSSGFAWCVKDGWSVVNPAITDSPTLAAMKDDAEQADVFKTIVANGIAPEQTVMDTWGSAGAFEKYARRFGYVVNLHPDKSFTVYPYNRDSRGPFLPPRQKMASMEPFLALYEFRFRGTDADGPWLPELDEYTRWPCDAMGNAARPQSRCTRGTEMKDLTTGLILMAASVLLSGCVASNMTELTKALAADPASACVTVGTPYGSGTLIRAGAAQQGMKISGSGGGCSVESTAPAMATVPVTVQLKPTQ